MAINTNKFLDDLQKDLTDMTSEERATYAQEAGFAGLQGPSKRRCLSCRYLFTKGGGLVCCTDCSLYA